MNEIQKLRDVQSWLDGEVPEGRRSEIEAAVSKDPELRSLAAELRAIKGILQDNEKGRSVPMPRELYWSAIDSSIRRGEVRAPGTPAGWVMWTRRMIPIAGLAALILVAVLKSGPDGGTGSGVGQEFAQELLTETPMEEMASVSFRSEAEGMTVVWVQGSDLR